MRFLVILLIVYLLFRLAVRFVLPWLLRSFIKRAQEQQGCRSDRRTGDVTIEDEPKKSRIGKDEGKYVDYEEVE